MVERKKYRVNIVNRYSPLNGITGESANELKEYLEEQNVHVNFIHVEASYAPISKKHFNELDNTYSIKTFYNGKNKMLRLLASLYEGYALIRKAKSLKADVTICLTDPPLLHLYTKFLLKNRKWILWSMDLYPEAFAADRLVSRNNYIYKLIYNFSIKHLPNFIIALGPFQLRYLMERYKKEIPSVILPCGIFEQTVGGQSAIPTWAHSNKILLGYCGNLGHAHSLDFLKLIIDNLDTNKFQFILSVYGQYANDITQYCNQKEGIIIVDKVARLELQYIDIHLSSLKEEWINICVPSKTVSSVCAHSSFLHCGYENSDNWQLLGQAGWLISPYNLSSEVQYFLNSIDEKQIIEKKNKASEIIERLHLMKQSAFKGIYEYIIQST